MPSRDGPRRARRLPTPDMETLGGFPCLPAMVRAELGGSPRDSRMFKSGVRVRFGTSLTWSIMTALLSLRIL